MSKNISGNTCIKILYLIAQKLSVILRTSLDLHRHLTYLTNSLKCLVPTERQNYGVSTDHQHNSEVSTANQGVSTDHHIIQGSLPTTKGSLPTTKQNTGVSTDDLPPLLLYSFFFAYDKI